MPRNILDDYLILSQPKENGKNKRIVNKSRFCPSNSAWWTYSTCPVFWNNRLNEAKLLLFGPWDEVEQHSMICSPSALEEEVMGRTPKITYCSTHRDCSPLPLPLEPAQIVTTATSIPHSASQDSSPDPTQDATSLYINHTEYRSVFATNILLGFLNIISNYTIILSGSETFTPGSFSMTTRTGPLNDYDLIISSSSYPGQNLRLLESLHVEYTDDLETIDAYMVSNGITMRLVIKRSLTPEDRTRGIRHLLTLCNYGQEIGVYMWNVDDELIETE